MIELVRTKCLFLAFHIHKKIAFGVRMELQAKLYKKRATKDHCFDAPRIKQSKHPMNESSSFH